MLLVVLSTYCFFDVLVAAAVVGSTCPKRGDASVKGGANTDNTVLEQTIWRLKTDSRKRFILFYLCMYLVVLRVQNTNNNVNTDQDIFI